MIFLLSNIFFPEAMKAKLLAGTKLEAFGDLRQARSFHTTQYRYTAQEQLCIGFIKSSSLCIMALRRTTERNNASLLASNTRHQR
jgi:hypothetical protein